MRTDVYLRRGPPAIRRRSSGRTRTGRGATRPRLPLRLAGLVRALRRAARALLRLALLRWGKGHAARAFESRARRRSRRRAVDPGTDGAERDPAPGWDA